MKRKYQASILVCAVLSIVPLSLASPEADQSHGAERVFHIRKAEVEKAIQELHPTLKGPLPILDGFAEGKDEHPDRFERGYYECAIQIEAEGADATRVRVTAKITAWYTDTNPSKSGYRVLPSNGRVEEDLLDRIEKAITPGSPASAAPQPFQLRASKPESSAPIRAERKTISPILAESPAAPVISAPSGSEDIDSLRRRREEAEKHLSELNGVVQNLEEILRNQTHPTDLAVVRKGGTHVMAKPSANGPVLFSADDQDEFQVLDMGPDWVHVLISGVSRGWIRRSDVTLPEGFNKPSSGPDNTAPAAEPLFHVVREQTNLFQGTWESLKGKTVKIIWAGPASAPAKPASGQVKRSFAKSLLVTAYREINSHDEMVAGVVIVFDSADGGQIAATLQSLKEWQTGSISEALFWRACSVDPPELFE